jgi:hypothetical protein
MFGGSPRSRIDPASLHSAAESLLAAYSSEKKRELRYSANLFARLILWGNAHSSAVWLPTQAPLEYCRLLIASLHEDTTPREKDALRASIIRCGSLFEKALYSASPLSKEEKQELHRRAGNCHGVLL